MRIPANSRGVLGMIYSLFILEVIVYAIYVEYLFRRSMFMFIVMSILTAISLLSMIYFRFSKIYTAVMIIDTNGVKLNMGKEVYSMQWDEIIMIGVTTYTIKPLSVIIFSRKYEPQKVNQRPNVKKPSNDFLYIKNRKGLIQEIMKHWDGKIINGEKNEY